MPPSSPVRRALGALAALTVGAALSAPAAAAPAVGPAVGPAARVVVQSTGDAAAVAERVRALGGEVTLDLPVVDGFAAHLPADRVDDLRRAPGVRAVTPDAPVHVQSTTSTKTGSDLKSVYRSEVGATDLAARGLTGAGVRVALVDTGVTPLPDLAGRLVQVDDPFQPVAELDGSREQVQCVDLSGDGDCVDRYGHGTFLASLIAGDGSSSGGAHAGVAPGAEIISIKLAGADGSADVSKVLAAVQWVVSFKEQYGIDVLNLSLGTDSEVPTELDPLNHAVQRAWRAGLVVVVAASNRGPTPGTISKPADDPFVLTVGAVDDRETPAVDDDRAPAWTAVGPTAHGRAKPDVVAPGARLVGLRAPSSTIEQLAPGGVDAAHRRGSGTSMAAAVTSGLVAQLLQARPEWTPDRVKAALVAGARDVNTTDVARVGAGLVHGPGALAAVATGGQGPITAGGKGSLQGSRGTVRVQRADCTTGCQPLEGEQSAQDGGLGDRDYDADRFTDTKWTGSSWYSSQWVGLSGSSWYGSSWYGSSWYGSSWYGVDGAKADQAPYGVPVPGSAWYGAWQ